MLLKWANRGRSRSNTFVYIYISLSLKFIGDFKLLFRFLISYLVLELWPKDWTSLHYITLNLFTLHLFDGIFRVLAGLPALLPSQTRIQTFRIRMFTVWRFRENLVDIGLVDSEKLGWNKYEKNYEILLMRRFFILVFCVFYSLSPTHGGKWKKIWIVSSIRIDWATLKILVLCVLCFARQLAHMDKQTWRKHKRIFSDEKSATKK